jgi:hypothetical protein
LNENRSSQIDYYQPLSTSTIVPTSITNNLNIPKLTTAQELLEDKFSIEILNNNKKKRIELTLGDKVCFVNHDSDLVCDTIVRGLLPKKSGGLESPTVYVLVADNKLDFYKIVEKARKKYKMNLDIVLNHTMVKRIFTIYQLADFLKMDLAKDIKKYESKLFIITGDFFLNDSYIEKEEKDWLYPQMIEAVKKVTDSIILMFSPITLPNLVNYDSKNKS